MFACMIRMVHPRRLSRMYLPSYAAAAVLPAAVLPADIQPVHTAEPAAAVLPAAVLPADTQPVHTAEPAAAAELPVQDAVNPADLHTAS